MLCLDIAQLPEAEFDYVMTLMVGPNDKPRYMAERQKTQPTVDDVVRFINKAGKQLDVTNRS